MFVLHTTTTKKIHRKINKFVQVIDHFKLNRWSGSLLFMSPKSIQASVTILENLHVILEKTPRDDIRTEVLPLLFNAFESTTIQVQVYRNLRRRACQPAV